MSSHNDHSQPPKSPKDALLEELESIKGLLDDDMAASFEDDLDIDIPILDDVVTSDEVANTSKPFISNNDNQEPSLLDLESIFDDAPDDITNEEDEHTSPTLQNSEPQTSAPTTSPEYDVLTPGSQPLDLEHISFEHLDDDIEIPSFTLDIATTTSEEASPPTLDNDTDEEAIDDTEDHQWLSGSIDITDDEDEPSYSSVTMNSDAATNSTVNPSDKLDLDLLIQEIVDELIPVIEDELRQRLTAYSPDIIKQLAQKYLDR